MSIIPEFELKTSALPGLFRPGDDGKLGVSDDLKEEVYIGWHPLIKTDKHKQFFYCHAFEPEIYFQYDAYLMVLSKGGIKLDNLLGKNKVLSNRMKSRYVKSLEEIHRQMNKTDDNSSSSSGDDAETTGTVRVNG